MPNITLTVYLYDTSNAPLKRKGIQLDLHNATTNLLLASDLSRDLNPPTRSGSSSNEWGGEFTYASVSDPVDILVTDAKYEYPGNTMRYVNGDRGGRVDMDLRKLPTKKGGQPSPPASATPSSIRRWVDSSPRWTAEEKEAVKGLIFNYAAVIVARWDDPNSRDHLASVESNWREAIDRLGFPPSLLLK